MDENISSSVDPNQELSTIFTDLAKMLYSRYGEIDLSRSVIGTFIFDNKQRVSEVVQIVADDEPYEATPDLLAQMSLRSQDILNLPKSYWLAGLTIEIKPGGVVNFEPTYLD